MAETYAVEATLEWRSNVPELLRQMMGGFEEVNRTINDLKDNLGDLASGAKGIAAFAREMGKVRVPQGVVDDLRALREATTGLGDLGDEAKGLGALTRQLSKLQVPTGSLDGLRDLQTATSGLADLQRGMADSAQATARAWREVAEATRQVRIPSGGGGPASPGVGRHSHGGSHVTLMDASMGAQMAGDAGMGFLERGFHAHAEVQLQEQMAQSDRKVTDAVLARANALIASLRKQYPALTMAEGLTLFRNSMGIFGDPEESLAALPGAARLQQLYQLAPLGRGGSGGSEVQAAEKAGDALQSFINPTTHKLDIGLYQQFMDFQARSYQAGGGLVDAKNWLAFARTSRAAGIGLNERALEEAQALLEMSPGRTGTALMSAFQVFGATTKHMTKANRAAWQQQGLLGKDGNIIDQHAYQLDPFAWVWNDLVPHLKAHGIKTRDQILRWLTENGQRSTISGILADIAIGQTPITRTADKMERQDNNLVDKLETSDTGRLAALSAAENNFFVAVGKFEEGPGVKLLTSLTNALNTLTDDMNAHPELAKNILLFGGGIAIVSKIMGSVGMAYLFVGSPLIAGVQALGGALPGVASGIAAVLAAAGKAAPAVPTAENPWGLAETGVGTALRWGSKLAAGLGLGLVAWEAGKSVATSPDWQALDRHIQQSADRAVANASRSAALPPQSKVVTLAGQQSPPGSGGPPAGPTTINMPPITVHTTVQIDGKNIPAKSTTTMRSALNSPRTSPETFDIGYGYSPP